MPLSPVSSTVDAGLAAIFFSSVFSCADRRAVADDAIEAVGLRLRRAKRAHFAAQPRRFERLFDQQRDLVEVEWLVRVVIRAGLHRFDRHVDARKRGEQNHQRLGIRLFDLLEHRQAVGVGKTVIEQHEVDPFAMLLERLCSGLRLDHAVAFLREAVAQRPADQLLVVDDENRGFGHSRLFYQVDSQFAPAIALH